MAAAHYQTVKPQFSPNHGENIAIEEDGAQNRDKAQWKFSKSFGFAFSDFPLKDDRKYEAIFNGSGHASIGLTQTDPGHLTDIQQAVKSNQILLVTDVRFHKRVCTVDIVKRPDGRRTFVFETKYRDSSPQGKTLVPGADVWIVIYLKFGEVTAEIKDKENEAALRFHKNVDSNIDLQNERLKISLRSPFPLAYAVLENSLEKSLCIHVKTEHIDDKEKPRLFHIKVGISNNNVNSATSLEFCPRIATKLERDDSIGDFYICMSKREKFHIHKDNKCIYTKSMSPEVNVSLPVYVCFEIFRIRLKTVELLPCTHESDAIENPWRGSVRDGTTPYATVNQLLRTLQGVDQDLEAGKFTVEVEKKLTDATNDLEKYVNYVSLDTSRAGDEIDDEKGYITPVSAMNITPNPGRRPTEHEEESCDRPTLQTLQNMLEQIEKTAKAHHFERQTSLDEVLRAVETNRAKIEEVQRTFEGGSIQQEPTRRGSMLESVSFQTHLQKICANFIQTVEVFPLCDYLFQYDIIHRDQYQNIADENKRQRTEACRTLFNYLSKKHYTNEQLEKIKHAFVESKQEHLLPQ